MLASSPPVPAAPLLVPNERLRLPVSTFATAGDESVVRLRPQWPALISMTRYARRATWRFGHRGAIIETVERRPRAAAPHDLIDVRLRFRDWSSALVRVTGRARQLEFFGRDGGSIAAVQLDECDRALDELVWLLMDDARPRPAGAKPAARQVAVDRAAVRAALPLLEYRADFDRIVERAALRRGDALRLAGPGVATAVSTDAVAKAVAAAVRAGIRLRLRLENAGGSMTWTPASAEVSGGFDYLELRSNEGRVHLGRRIGPTWLTTLASAAGGGPSLEAESAGDGGWVRVEAAADRDRDAWRDICRTFVRA